MDNTDKNAIENVLHSLELLLDKECSYQRVLSSMCTPPPEIVREIASRFAEINLGDPGLFPKTKQLEQEVLQELAAILHAPVNFTGTITSGGSESNLLGCWAARNWGKKEKGIKKGTIILPKSAHASFEKAIDILDIKPIWVSLTDNYQIDVEEVQGRITKQTIGMIGIAGTTGTGVCDDIKALSEIAIDNNLYLHVDAAFGGLIFPFLPQLNRSTPVFDFLLEGVNSITIDTHKLLGSLIPGGSIIFRSSQFSQIIATSISYLADTTTEQLTITGTRPATSVIASWVLLKKLGAEYIINRVRQSLELTDYLVTGLRSMNKIILPFEPSINIVGFKNKVLSNKKLQSKLWKKDWKLSIYDDWARIVVMPHLVKATIDAFLKDLSVILSGAE